MQEVKMCLLLNERTEEAVNFYVSLFANSSIKNTQRYGPNMPVAEGQVLLMEFNIKGMDMIALNGPETNFTDAISIMVNADTQEEIDRYYDGLAANGGKAIPCGWVQDRFGVTWQIVWPGMSKLFSKGDVAATQRTFQAMMKMYKLDIATLQAAYDGKL